MQHMGIDVGRHQVKAVSAERKVTFKSRVGEWRERRLVNGTIDYEVEIDGKKYFVADLAEESYFVREMATESKIHEETKVLFLTVVALLHNGDSLAVTTGLPISQHTPAGKQAFIDLVAGTHLVRVNNKTAAFTIVPDKLGIMPEGGGAYWDGVLSSDGQVRNPELTKGLVRGIDPGRRTVNYFAVNAKRYLDRDSGTLDYGVQELFNAHDQPDEKACEQFSRRIVADLSKRWMHYKPAEDIVMLTGGGALLLEKFLRPHFPLLQVSGDPIFANAAGFWKLGMARWAAR